MTIVDAMTQFFGNNPLALLVFVLAVMFLGRVIRRGPRRY